MYNWLQDMIHQEYAVVRVLKESSRGSVRLIRHKATGKQFILRQFVGNAEVYQKLLGYSCQNLPEILEVAVDGEKALVIEEFIEGDTLDFLLEGALFTPQETKEIVTQLCQALWVLHSMAAVHRDIKPENVIIRRRQAILIDFDAARLHKPEQEADTQVLGTAGFAAPEQYGLSQSDVRTDLYALGVLMNVMLTGEHPSKKLAEGRMGRIIERCTRVNPEKRYRDVLHLMCAL